MSLGVKSNYWNLHNLVSFVGLWRGISFRTDWGPATMPLWVEIYACYFSYHSIQIPLSPPLRCSLDSFWLYAYFILLDGRALCGACWFEFYVPLVVCLLFVLVSWNMSFPNPLLYYLIDLTTRYAKLQLLLDSFITWHWK